MNVRSQISMVFHLDKCIGCHTCSIACKNLWTDRRGTEYMWWNNVETKPGTGFPTKWEDQEKYHGGWEVKNGKLQLRSTSKTADRFQHLPQPQHAHHGRLLRAVDLRLSAPVQCAGGRRPAHGDARSPWSPASSIEIEAGPNWDDDLGGSPIYAENDPNLKAPDPEQRAQLSAVEQLVFFYFPRICNHCLNPSCVASCPSGALYKRGEDGIVLVDQKRCRGWRMCIAACPYKKVFYNWNTGKSEKCILCYPRLETGQAPACFHSCVGRIRYLGVVLYDASRIEEVASRPDEDLVEAQRSLILDPNDPGSRRRGAKERHPRLGHRVRAALAGLSVRKGLENRAAAAHRIPDHADAVLRASNVSGACRISRMARSTTFRTICSTTSMNPACR